MKRLILLGSLLLASVTAFGVTIYKYVDKGGVTHFMGGKPTGLTTKESALFTKPLQGEIDALKGSKQLEDRSAVKAIMKKDTAPVVTPPPVVVNPPPVIDYITVNHPPKSAVSCKGNMEICVLPAGVTAKVWFGAGGSSGKWVSKENVTGSIACNASVMGDPGTGSYNRCFYVDNKNLEKVLDPKGQMLMPYVNAALTPKGSDGFSTPMIKPAPPPPADGVGAFRISCNFSHMNNDDAIVFPGVPNATHHHTYFGNVLADAYSTTDSLRTTGNSSCAGGILNRSGYWIPSLINTNTGAPAKPTYIVVYYKGLQQRTNQYITMPPKGLKMIAGNAKPLAIADAQGGFMCQDQTQVMNPANWGILWQSDHIKQSCGGPNQMLRLMVSFPQCWDGKNLDSPDHKSHMAYSCGDECVGTEGKVVKTFNGCPASHPVLIPSIAINADYFGLDANAKYRLSSDNYSTAYPGGYSLHGDWMNGWDESIMARMVKNCLVNAKNCGGPNLGDGEKLYGVNED